MDFSDRKKGPEDQPENKRRILSTEDLISPAGPEPRVPRGRQAAPMMQAPMFAGPGMGAMRPQGRSARDFLLMVRERWIWGLLLGLILGAGYVYVEMSKPEVYRTETTVEIKPKPDTVVTGTTPVEDLSVHSDAILQTHLEKIRSQSFADYVAASLTEEEEDLITAAFTDPEAPEGAGPSAVQIMRGRVLPSIRKGTYILVLTAMHRDPQAAQLMANRYARKYIDYSLDRSSSGLDSATVRLEREVQKASENVKAAQERLEDFRREKNMVSLDERVNLINSRLTRLAGAAQGVEVEILNLRAQLEQVRSFQEEGLPLTDIPFISSYGSIPAFMRQLDQLQAERDMMERKYLERHPKMIENANSVESINRLIEQNAQTAVKQIENQLIVQDERLATIKAEQERAEEQVLKLAELRIEFQDLARFAAAKEAHYNNMILRLQEMEIMDDFNDTIFQINDEAYVPSVPVAPKFESAAVKGVLIVVACFFGLPIGLGFLDNRVKAAWEVEDSLNVPLLGEIPKIKGIPRKKRAHVMREGGDHAACESFRGLFSQLQVNTEVKQYPKSLMVTSTLPGEGKSFLACNLAQTFADHGKKVLLVDADFRGPSLYRHFGEDNKSGIIAWLEASEADRYDNEKGNELLGILPITENLSVLRTGGSSNRPTEMFDRESFRDLFERLRGNYDLIVIDTPPVGVFPDAILLAGMADEVVYTCQFKKVNKKQIKTYLERIRETGVPLTGLVLNGVPAGRSAAYYDYYGYGYNGAAKYKKYYKKAEAAAAAS